MSDQDLLTIVEEIVRHYKMGFRGESKESLGRRLSATLDAYIVERLAAAKVPCFLVWRRADDAAEGGRPYLMAVDLTLEQAERHKKAVEDEARIKGQSTIVMIEESWLNHLYGESMTTGYDALRSVLKEMRDSGKGG